MMNMKKQREENMIPCYNSEKFCSIPFYYRSFTLQAYLPGTRYLLIQSGSRGRFFSLGARKRNVRTEKDSRFYI